MSVTSFPVQCATGEQIPTSKAIHEEPLLLQVDCPQEREVCKLSRGVLLSKNIVFDADQCQDEPKSYAETSATEECNYASLALTSEMPNGKQAIIERLLVHGECSQARNSCGQNVSFRETDASTMADSSRLDGTSDAKLLFPEETFCKESGRLSSPHLPCNGKGNCHEQEIILIKNTCSTSDYELPGVVFTSKDKKGEPFTVETSTLFNMQDSHKKDIDQLGTLHELMDITHPMQLQDHNNVLHLASVSSVQMAKVVESQVHDRNQEGESGPLGVDYTEDHTDALWVKVHIMQLHFSSKRYPRLIKLLLHS